MTAEIGDSLMHIPEYSLCYSYPLCDLCFLSLEELLRNLNNVYLDAEYTHTPTHTSYRFEICIV